MMLFSLKLGGIAVLLLASMRQPCFPFVIGLQGEADVARQHEERGNLELERRDSAAAAREFRSALMSNPHSVSAHIGLGIALRQSGDKVGAVIEFQTAIQLDPGDPRAHCNLAITFGQEGDWEESKAELLRLLNLKPDYADAHYFQRLATILEGGKGP